jgi:alpha-D-ribose 1-methylphosphonate 5-triphosphate synthase subunit PhnH
MVAAAFQDPVLAAQATFRAVLGAIAQPGTIAKLTGPLQAPAPLRAGTAAIALTLCDHDTPIWLDDALREPAVLDWLRFHTGARIVDEPRAAAFAFVSAPRGVPPFETFSPGTLEYPDRSTTIVLQLDRLTHGRCLVLSGPGIRGERRLRAAPLPDDLPERLAANARLFPRGIDLLLATEAEIAALPRSTRVADGGV